MRQSFWIQWCIPVGLSLLLICAVTGDAEPRDGGSINAPRQSPADSGSFRTHRSDIDGQPGFDAPGNSEWRALRQARHRERRQHRPDVRQERREEHRDVRQGRHRDRQERRQHHRDVRQERRRDRRDARQERREFRRDIRQERRRERRELRHERRDIRRERRQHRRDARRERREWYEERWRFAPGAMLPSAVFRALTCTTTIIIAHGTTYYRCGPTWYHRTYRGGNMFYIVVAPPPGY
jgi:hypothetical protein